MRSSESSNEPSIDSSEPAVAEELTAGRRARVAAEDAAKKSRA
jgi:hypothetical protein